MKNIMVIDGAINCTFSIFQATENEFSLIFPGDSQEVQFNSNFWEMKNIEEIEEALNNIWGRPIRRRDANGIHGILFYELDKYRQAYRVLREDGMDPSAYNHAQRRLFGMI